MSELWTGCPNLWHTTILIDNKGLFTVLFTQNMLEKQTSIRGIRSFNDLYYTVIMIIIMKCCNLEMTGIFFSILFRSEAPL